MISDLSEFVVNNFSLKSLNLSWSEISSEEMLLFLERIQHIKHLQHLDISTIPIEGPSSNKLIELMKEHIINNPSLIHLNMSSCNLDHKEIQKLWQGIKKSKSLLSVHLSGNTSNAHIQKIVERGFKKFSKTQQINKII